MILDADSANKTFSVIMSVNGTAVTASATSFSSPTLGAKYTSSDYFKNFVVYWTSGAASGRVQNVTGYTPGSGIFTTSDLFPNPIAAIPAAGDSFSIVPRTAENIVKHLNDLNTTTFSIVGSAEVIGISGDYVQLSTQLAGSSGSVFVTGGSANKFGVLIQSIVAGAPLNDVTVNSVAGLAKGLLVKLTVDNTVTTGDLVAPYDTIISTGMISALPLYFTGMNLTFLTGINKGLSSSIFSYDYLTGTIVLATPMPNAILVSDTFRVDRSAFVASIVGASAPYTVAFNNYSNTAIDVSGFITTRLATIRDNNGLNFSNLQLQGIDGYKYFTGIIQKTQWTIDGLNSDPTNYAGIAAGGTQFEVLPPVLVKLVLTISITPDNGIALSSISADIANAVSGYVNSLGVGDDVVLSEIIAAAQSITGVFDVQITNHTSNVVIADGELVHLASEDLQIG
jgi:hypothetical protein